ncbi:hypothetical protein BJY04DRAFT_186176 [Aspergillus karnatakaensis]|uniref:uncharacterized protein n=1 Tax=Aspergillus karnatakaensis TaxID=1810916 RepID=UPI003CCCB64B
MAFQYFTSTASASIQQSMAESFLENSLDAVLVLGAQNAVAPLDTHGRPACTTMWNLLTYASIRRASFRTNRRPRSSIINLCC